MLKKFLLSACGVFFLVSCSNEGSVSETQQSMSIPTKSLGKPTTIKSSDRVDIIASYVVHDPNYIKSKIEIFDKSKGKVVDTFYQILKTTNPNEEIEKTLKDKTFTGELIVTHRGEPILLAPVVGGVPEPIQNLVPTQVDCTVTTVHDCVSYKIEDMNIVEYGLCLVAAPECYGGLWAICTYDVCVEGIEYDNPVD